MLSSFYRALFAALTLTLGLAGPALAASGNVDLPRFPSISPDGAWIVFSWRGDLWKTPSASPDGAAVTATRLTSHPGDDLRSAWSADGRLIAFDSDRSGYQNIHLMAAEGTAVRQLTSIDRPCTLGGFGVDEQGQPIITFSAALEGDLYRAPRLYMVGLDGGEMRRLMGAFGTEALISPDGTRIAFTRGGSEPNRRHYRGSDNRNLWLYSRADQSFRQLTTWHGTDARAAWADPDSILFLSDRDLGCVNLYRMTVTGGEAAAQRLTAFDQHDVKGFDVSANGAMATLVAWDTLYTLNLKDPAAAAVPLTIHANEDERDNYEFKAVDREVSEAALSPDGKVMAFVAYGEVYVRHVDDKRPTRRLTATHAREKHIAWSPDGLKLYFVSDRDGTDSIQAATVALTRDEIRDTFKKTMNPPVEKPAVEPAPAVEPDPAPPEPLVGVAPTEPPPVEPPAAEPPAVEPPAVEPPPIPLEPAASTPPTTPAAAAEPGAAPAQPPADTPPAEVADDEADETEAEIDPALDPKRWHNAVTITITPVVETHENDRMPSPSPDGKWLAFRRGRGDLVLRDLAGGEERTLVPGWDTSLNWRWSPDSKFIAYEQSDLDFNADIWIARADASQPAVNITRHPDNDGSPRWSADGRVLSFISERVNEEFDVWMVYLDKDLEALTPDERVEYYKETAEQAKKRKPLEVPGGKDQKKKEKEENGEEKNDDAGDDDDKPAKKDDDNKEPKPDDEPIELELDDAYLRLRRITSLTGDEGNHELTAAGDRLVFSATIGDTANLHSVKWDGSERKQIAGNVNVQHLNLAGDKIIFVGEGRAGLVPPGGGETEYVDLNDRIRIDLQEQAGQKFLEAARTLGEEFYHPTMKGLDWPALTAKYHALARQTRTAGEFNEVGNRFLGELNASHLGISSTAPPSPNRVPFGRLGTIHHRHGDGFVITAIVLDTPAALGRMALRPGDVILSIDEVPFAPHDTIESRLQGLMGREIILTFRRTLDDGTTAELRTLLTPITYQQEQTLKYEAWQKRSAQLASDLSGGRIGYVHIEGMSQPSLDEFERDLYAAAEGKVGLIIDVRNNGGGWTADRLLSSIMVQPHAYTIPRGGDPNAKWHYPQDRLFIQRYTLPINLLCNEKSFSNAEIISHAFKTLKRGTLVGQQTYGGVISTGGTTLIDGTTVRLPFRGWFLPDGTEMENNGAVPDILVPQTPEAEARDEDEQLKAAVEDLMKRLPG